MERWSYDKNVRRLYVNSCDLIKEKDEESKSNRESIAEKCILLCHNLAVTVHERCSVCEHQHHLRREPG